MSTATTNRARTIPKRCCEDECPSGSRNNYFMGKRLSPDSFAVEQRYHNGRRHLFNRAIHGWGAVYGFALTLADTDTNGVTKGTLTIGAGLALDQQGRELWQPASANLTLDELVVLDKLVVLDSQFKPLRVEGKLDDRFAKLGAKPEDCWLLSAHYAEKLLDPQTIKGECDCDRKEWDRTCETVVYAIRKIDCKDCCQPQDCELECCCDDKSPCCSEHRDKLEAINADETTILQEMASDNEKAHEKKFVALAKRRIEIESIRHPRGGCSCLCHHLTGLTIGGDCDRLRDVGDCTSADFGNGVALACLKLSQDSCGDLAIATIHDACGPRRLVKRNDLLFDLINGCDVTRIAETGWESWHRRDNPPVPFEDFLDALGWDKTPGVFDDYVTNRFWIRFSRPVRADTLKADCFTMTVSSDQTEGCWRELYRVPIVAVEFDRDANGYTSKVAIVVSAAWLGDGVDGDGSIFLRGDTYVEIEVRGDYIVDCNGQTVDANPRGLSPFPTGGDGPGDSYCSNFTVAQRVRPVKSSAPLGGARKPAKGAIP